MGNACDVRHDHWKHCMPRLSKAISSGRAQIVKSLLHFRADPNMLGPGYGKACSGVSPTLAAARANNTEMLRYIIEARADLHRIMAGGQSSGWKWRSIEEALTNVIGIESYQALI